MILKKYTSIINYLAISLPIAFAIVFLGILPPKYDVVLYVDNIVGEGICETYTCNRKNNIAGNYLSFYFGSELKKATIKGYNYDVEKIVIRVSDISEFDLESYDITFADKVIGHYSFVDRIPTGEFDGNIISLSEDGQKIHVEVKNPNIGMSIGFFSYFMPLWLIFLYFVVILLTTVLLSFLLYQISLKSKRIVSYIVGIASIVATILLGMNFCGSLPFANYTLFLLNILLVTAVAGVINSVTLPWLGTVMMILFLTFGYVVNYYVILFRNKPIMPADISAMKTAEEVLGGYTFVPTISMILSVIVVLLYCAEVIFSWSLNYKKEDTITRNILRRISLFFISIGLIVISLENPIFKSLDSFTWDAYLLRGFHEEGMLISFVKHAINSRMKEPDGYNTSVINGFLSDYSKSIETDCSLKQPIKIIMVMNESYSDLREVGLSDDIDVMPFYDEISENIVKGDFYVSIFGGGTCNSEFEALTGNSLAFLGTGVYPYTQNINDNLFSLASYFSSLGFETEAFHANAATNWNRNNVYNFLGFTMFNSIEDYYSNLSEVKRLHNLTAESSDYEFLASKIEFNKNNKQFLFNVTMQNHSAYERWEDVEKNGSVAKYGSELYPDTQVYLSLIAVSDNEIKSFVEKYKDSEEPTMIIFFGDHQPGLPQVAQNEIYTDVYSYLDWYKTKYFIWTNYDIEENTDLNISANYLPYLILKYGNFKMPPYIQMLGEVYNKYPIISAMGVIDFEGNEYSSVNEIDDELINKYRYIQYANMTGDLSDEWFLTK